MNNQIKVENKNLEKELKMQRPFILLRVLTASIVIIYFAALIMEMTVPWWPTWNVLPMLVGLMFGVGPMMICTVLFIKTFSPSFQRKVSALIGTCICFCVLALSILFPFIYASPHPHSTLVLERAGEQIVVTGGKFVWLPDYTHKSFSSYYTVDSTTGIHAEFYPEVPHVLDLIKQFGTNDVYHQSLDSLFRVRLAYARELTGPEATPECVLCVLKDQDWQTPPTTQHTLALFRI